MMPTIRTRPLKTLLAAALAAASILLGAGPAAAGSGSSVAGDIPSVYLRPANDNPLDGGQWFLFHLRPGASTQAALLVSNSAKVAQTIRLSADDLAFTNQGTPYLVPKPVDVGRWLQVAVGTLTVPPLKTMRVPLSVKVPLAAAPGQHIGAIVATSLYRSGHITIVKRVAMRFYVDVPGVAIPSMGLKALHQSLQTPLWPHRVDVSAVLANTGLVGFRPAVTVNGRHMTGAMTLAPRQVSPYAAAVPVPWWGGRIRLVIHASATGVRSITRTVTLWVIPWALVAITVVGLTLLTFISTLGLRRRRARRQHEAALRAKLAALESRLGDPVPGPRPAAEELSGADRG